LAPQRLTVHQEQKLAIAAVGGDPVACRKLVEVRMPAIATLARRFEGGRVERRELLQEGVAGLLFAARRYNAGLGTPFWAYASFWVRKAMQELVADLEQPIALSDRAVRDLSHIRRARNEALQRRNGEPTTEQLGAATGLTPSHVESLLAAARMPRRLDDRLTSSDPSGPTLGETITDPVAEQAYEKVLDTIEIRGVLDLINKLAARERAVILGHYGLGHAPRTLSEIGSELGLTAERARQIEAGALSKVREAMARSALAPTELAILSQAHP
jgi:RNA polymerase primary sigma factor